MAAWGWSRLISKSLLMRVELPVGLPWGDWEAPVSPVGRQGKCPCLSLWEAGMKMGSLTTCEGCEHIWGYAPLATRGVSSCESPIQVSRHFVP